MSDDNDESHGPDFGLWFLLLFMMFHAHMNFKWTMKRLDAIEAKIAPSAEQEQK
jgi:hypothetical protein